jgi:hypothetical protein
MDILTDINLMLGILGTASGLLGTILGWRGYRLAKTMKTLDLRLELRKADAEIRSRVRAMPELLNRAKRSREAILAASGLAQSGAMQFCRDELRNSSEQQQRLEQDLPADKIDYRGFPPEAIEQELVRRHAALEEANKIISKYEGWLADDAQDRAHVVANRAKFL